jgi:hypothetical protein
LYTRVLSIYLLGATLVRRTRLYPQDREFR